MGRKFNPRLAMSWRRRLDRQARSGLSVAEFCRREKVSQPSFYQWRKRLAPEQDSAGPPLFVPVEIEGETDACGTTEGVKIDLPNGSVVRLPITAEVSLVVAAISAAAGVPVERRLQPC
jgi:hypothetical protein